MYARDLSRPHPNKTPAHASDSKNFRRKCDAGGSDHTPDGSPFGLVESLSSLSLSLQSLSLSSRSLTRDLSRAISHARSLTRDLSRAISHARGRTRRRAVPRDPSTGLRAAAARGIKFIRRRGRRRCVRRRESREERGPTPRQQHALAHALRGHAAHAPPALLLRDPQARCVRAPASHAARRGGGATRTPLHPPLLLSHLLRPARARAKRQGDV